MMFILLGVLGFVLLLVSDISGLKNKRTLQYLLAFLGTSIIFTSSVLILMNGSDYILALPYRIMFGSFSLLFFFLLIYSVVFEVRTSKGIVTYGTYALVRHPGVIWLLLFYTFGSFVFLNTDILIAGIVWSSVNVLYVHIQERFIFLKIFEGYCDYKLKTPMLFPTYKSFKECLKTLHGGKDEKLTRNA